MLTMLLSFFLCLSPSIQASYAANKFCSNLMYGYVEKQTDSEYTPVFKDTRGQWKMISTESNCTHKVHSIYGVNQQKDVVNLQSFFDLWAYEYKHHESLGSDSITPQDIIYAQKYLRTLKGFNININKNYSSLLKKQLKESLNRMRYSWARDQAVGEKRVSFNGFVTSKKEGLLKVYSIAAFDPSLLTEGLQSYPEQNIDDERKLVTCYLKPQTNYLTREWLNFERKLALGVVTLSSIAVLVYKNLNRKDNETREFEN